MEKHKAFSYKSKKLKTVFYLHEKMIIVRGSGQAQPIYYFAREVREGWLDRLPPGLEVKENPRTGLPYLDGPNALVSEAVTPASSEEDGLCSYCHNPKNSEEHHQFCVGEPKENSSKSQPTGISVSAESAGKEKDNVFVGVNASCVVCKKQYCDCPQRQSDGSWVDSPSQPSNTNLKSAVYLLGQLRASVIAVLAVRGSQDKTIDGFADKFDEVLKMILEENPNE